MLLDLCAVAVDYLAAKQSRIQCMRRKINLWSIQEKRRLMFSGLNRMRNFLLALQQEGDADRQVIESAVCQGHVEADMEYGSFLDSASAGDSSSQNK